MEARSVVELAELDLTHDDCTKVSRLLDVTAVNHPATQNFAAANSAIGKCDPDFSVVRIYPTSLVEPYNIFCIAGLL